MAQLNASYRFWLYRLISNLAVPFYIEFGSCQNKSLLWGNNWGEVPPFLGNFLGCGFSSEDDRPSPICSHPNLLQNDSRSFCETRVLRGLRMIGSRCLWKSVAKHRGQRLYELRHLYRRSPFWNVWDGWLSLLDLWQIFEGSDRRIFLWLF